MGELAPDRTDPRVAPAIGGQRHAADRGQRVGRAWDRLPARTRVAGHDGWVAGTLSRGLGLGDTGANMAGALAALMAQPSAPLAVLEVDQLYVAEVAARVRPVVVALLNPAP